MKRILLILTVYVLASVGAKAQVVGEEPYEILWDMEFDSTNYFNSNSFCISADSTSYYYQGGIYNYQSIIYKRNIETNEIEAEYEIPKSDSCLWYMQVSDKYLSCYALFRHAIVLRNPNTFEFIKELKIDINQLINNFDSKYEDLSYRDHILTNNSKYAIVMYRFRDNEHKYYYILVAYDINNDTYKMFYSNFYLKNDNYYDYKIEKLQLSNDGNKLYAIRYYGYSPGDLDFGLYEWDISNDFEVKNLYLNLTSHGVKGNYQISPDDTKLFLYNFELESKFLYYDLINYEHVLSKGHSLPYNFCFSEFENWILFADFKYRENDMNYYVNNIYNFITNEKLEISKPTSSRGLIFRHPFAYITKKSLMITYSRNLSNKIILRAIKFNYATIMGTKEEEGKIELLYPNPANNIVNIPVSNDTKKISISSLNVEIVIKYDDIITNDGYYQIDVSRLMTGAYIVLVENESEQFTYKFIKE